MNLADDCNVSPAITHTAGASLPSRQAQPLHRIAEVQKEQGVSHRSVARRTGMSMEQVRSQLDPSVDLKLSDLYQWQKALEVPIGDLLNDADAPLSGAVLNRARMLRTMKTVRAMKDLSKDAPMERFITMLENQLLEMMPELSEVTAWHTVGQRRTHDEVGRTAERPVSDTFVRDGLR
jgi:transcriptional regulator with XRE-family HTH domain